VSKSEAIGEYYGSENTIEILKAGTPVKIFFPLNKIEDLKGRIRKL